MSALQKIRDWLKSFPKIGEAIDLCVDYYADQPENSSIAPSGLLEVSRKVDILGNITVENQYNFALYFVFPKSPGDDVGATKNAEWLLDFQNWVQQQSVCRLAPAFGDDPKAETIKAQNGEISYAGPEGIAMYSVLLSVNFIKKHEVK